MRMRLFFSALFFISMSSGAIGDDTSQNQSIGYIKAPHYGETLLHFYQQNYYTAITHLLAAQKQQRLKHHKHDAELLLGSLYLAYGMHNQASMIFENLSNDQTSIKTRNQAWFYLAKIYHQRGYSQKAQNALTKIEGSLESNALQQQRLLLEASILMANQDYEKASTVLKAMQPDSITGAFGRYNLGVALIKSEQFQQGIDALTSVGNMEADNEEFNALRDRANLTLGFTYLEQYKGHQAQSHFERIQLDGPYASQALLGLGWTHSTLSQYHQALVYWQELQQRNKLDDAVQESLLAAPYALDQLFAHKQALQQYQNAVEIYKTQLQRIQYFIETIPGSQFTDDLLGTSTQSETGWFWQLQHLTNITENYYLQELFSQNNFQELLKNYRDLLFMKAKLQQKQADLTLYYDMLNVRRNKLRQHSADIEKQTNNTHLDSFNARNDALASHLSLIEKNPTPRSLASPQEIKQLDRSERIKKRIEQLPAHLRIDHYQDRLRLLKGLVLWNINSQFDKRLQQKRQSLKAIDKSIEEYGQHQKSIKQKQHDASQTILSHQKQITELQARTHELKRNIDKLLNKQSHDIEQMAITVLQEKSERIADYLAQASIAIAQIYDRADEGSGGKQ